MEDADIEESQVEFSDVIEEKKMVIIGEGNGVDCDIGNVKSDIEEVGTHKAKSLIEVKSTYFVEGNENTEQKTVNTENSKPPKPVDVDKFECGRKRRLSNTVQSSPKTNTCSELEDSEDSVQGVKNDSNDNDKTSCKRQKIRLKVVNTDLRRKIENNKKTNESSSDEDKNTSKEHEPLTGEQNDKKKGS